ncbi:MAG: hypothetical protein SWO11_23215, partial [Thermodesulfobacteriota bacterium]|nr:hypothetical protein [Thermodesulfobacteriota bacterium]
MRCGTLGMSGQVTLKFSIRNWGVLYINPAFTHRKLKCLTLGGLYSVLKEVWLRYCGTAGKPGGKRKRQ